MKRILLTLALLVLPRLAFAQVVPIVGTERVGWDQGCPATDPNCSTTAVTAQALGYEMQIDGAAPVTLTGITCTGTVKPYACSANPPPIASPGQHTESLRAFLLVGTTKLTSAFSNVITVNVTTAPAAPSNFRRLPTP